MKGGFKDENDISSKPIDYMDVKKCLLKFRFSEKATTFWRNLPLSIDVTKGSCLSEKLIRLKKMCQITNMSRKFEFPTPKSKKLIQILFHIKLADKKFPLRKFKTKKKIAPNFVSFSEYMNFKTLTLTIIITNCCYQTGNRK